MNRDKLLNAVVALLIALVPATLVYCQARHESDVKYEIAKYQSSVGYETLAKSVDELQRAVAELRGARLGLPLDLDFPGAGSGSAAVSSSMRPAAFRELPDTLDQALGEHVLDHATGAALTNE